MATVDAEKKLQKRVLGWLVNDLGYTYLGSSLCNCKNQSEGSRFTSWKY